MLTTAFKRRAPRSISRYLMFQERYKVNPASNRDIKAASALVARQISPVLNLGDRRQLRAPGATDFDDWHAHPGRRHNEPTLANRDGDWDSGSSMRTHL